MKKFFICAVFAVLTIASCKKDALSSVTEEEPTVVNNAGAASNGGQIVRVDLTGQQFENPCTGGILTVQSGILQFNIAPDGITIRSTVNSHLVMQDVDGTIYHGVFVETFGQNGSISHGTLHDTLRFILNPEGGGTNITLHSVFHITVNANGVFTATVEQFTLGCQ